MLPRNRAVISPSTFLRGLNWEHAFSTTVAQPPKPTETERRSYSHVLNGGRLRRRDAVVFERHGLGSASMWLRLRDDHELSTALLRLRRCVAARS